MTLVTVSADAAARCKAFQFIEGRPDRPLSQDSNKENEHSVQHKAVITSPFKASIKRSVREYSLHKAPPSTPATRLPLADLIGNADEASVFANAALVSPEEHISWRPTRSPRRSQQKRTPTPNRAQRARSSSPPSSSQVKPKRQAVGSANPNIQPLLYTLQIPQSDPAASLWSRYAVRDGMPGVPAASLASLLDTSSPHSADQQAGNISGLRRWTSCGIEWPTSKSKRRKIRQETIAERVDSLFDPAPPSAPVDTAENAQRSRIGTLLERIQESLAKPIEVEEAAGPSSSSPLPERHGAAEKEIGPPVRAQGVLSGKVSENDDQKHQPPNYAAPPAAEEPSSSSFGTDDLDLTIFDVADIGSTKTERNDATNEVEADPELVQKPDGNEVIEPAAAQPVTTECVDSFLNDDEFGEELDLSTVDLEVVASLYDVDLASSTTLQGRVLDSMIPQAHEPSPERCPNSPADEFGDDDIDEESFAAAEVAATQSYSKVGLQGYSSESKPGAIQRYLVTNVIEGHYSGSNGRKLPEKIILVEDDKTKLAKAIILRQSWLDTRCTKGSYVHVIGEFSRTGQCLIDDDQNMLILHPDHLISALVVADSFGCIRRAVLQDRVKATSDPSPPQTYGTMLHEIFQEAITANAWDTETLCQIISTIVANHIEDLYQVKLSVEQATDYLKGKMPELQAWAKIFVRAQPRNDGIVQDRKERHVKMSINKLLDVEEHVWSPMYGLKGNIDATVQVVMQDEGGERVLAVPFELKTGKNSSNASHRAQTALYTLLLGDRYDVGIAYGILYYLETSETHRIPAMRHELCHMIMQRNELACYVRERLSLPPMLKNPHQCNRCYAKVPCLSYHKLVEDGDGETSGMKEKFDEVVQHLKPSHQEFFKKWDDLLTKEESEMMKFRRELWTMLSTEREKLGRCFANVTLEPGTTSEERGTSKINRFQYTFRKHEETLEFSFNESHITVGEPIVISDEASHYALAKGYVTSIQKRHISVAVDRRLHNTRIRQPGFDLETNQSFAGIMEVDNVVEALSHKQSSEKTVPTLYRLDKDEFSNGLATVRNNLVQIMTDTVFHARDIRRLVVDAGEPRFKPISTAYNLSGPLSQMNVNDDQRAALEKVMMAQDYALVLGMPGTGKTTTIAHIIRALVAKGKSVLLTSYTHTAVDNILLKIRDDDIGVLRLGAIAKIHPEVRGFAVLAAEPKSTIEELQKMYQEPQVVATTCLGINHPLFNERIFDYCVVDEASQITLPVCLGPIRMAKCFILVGDHYQLPPLVQNREAQEGGLDISLFKLLCERHPSAVVALHHQYRMNSEIMSLSNTLIYNGRLKCGSEAVAKRRLSLPYTSLLAQFPHQTTSTQPNSNICPSLDSPNCWLRKTLGEDSPPVIFLNTDTLLPSSREKAHGARITNPLEAHLTTILATALLTAGLPASQLGIITLYRSQLALIKSNLLTSTLTTAHSRDVIEQIEAHTADRFQGRDKDVILLCCVRSNERDVVGELLKDWRRVNVAVTRAKRKLIIVGSKGTLGRGDELLGRLMALCEKEGWVVDLPVNAVGEEEYSRGVGMGETVRGSQSGFELQKLRVERDGAGVTRSVGGESRNGKEKDGAALRQSRAPLQPRATNNVNKAFKIPSKIGKVSERIVLGGSSMKSRRPVLADIINDIVGDVEFE